MTLIEKIRSAIEAKNMPPIFNSSDIDNAGIEDINSNISNYDKNNKGPCNSHTTVLVSRVIDNVSYYTFDEQIFE